VLVVRGQQRLEEDEGVRDDEAVVAPPPPADDAVRAGVLHHHVRLRHERRRHGSRPELLTLPLTCTYSFPLTLDSTSPQARTIAVVVVRV
jgi:hypothetical protein